MNGPLHHHAAQALAAGAHKVAALADTLRAYDPPGADWIMIRLESIAADLRRDAREYESLAESDPCASVSIRGLTPLPPFEG
jgi:hypothetical protein